MISGMSASQFAQKLVAVERQPKDQLFDIQRRRDEAMQSAYGTLSSALSSVTSALDKMDKGDFQPKKADVTGESAAVTVSDKVPASDYKLEVKQLAQAHQLSKALGKSEKDPLTLSGELEITVAGKTGSLKLDLSKCKTAADLRDAINNDKTNPGVNACLVRTGNQVELMLTSNETGSTHEMKVTVGGKDWGMVERSKAKDAEVMLNGIKITSDKNQLTNVIDGMNIELKKVDEKGKSSMISVKADTEANEKAIDDFVGAINGMLDKVNSLTQTKIADKNDKDHAYMAKDKIGILSGDSTVRSLQQMVRNIAFKTVKVGTKDMRLADVGIELDRYGKLQVNKKKLTDVMKDNPTVIKEVFTGKDGIAGQLKTQLKPFTKFDGYIHMKKENISNQLHSLNDKMDQYDQFMNNKYQMYLKQFTAMENTINELNSASGLFA